MVSDASCYANSIMPQIDFAPSIAALMGVPIPFGNIGKIFRPLWDVAHSSSSVSSSRFANHDSGTCPSDSRHGEYAAALEKNAAQVAY